MEIEDLMLVVVDAIREAGVPFLLVGSFSSNYFGVPRSTEDVDLVVELDSHSVRDITRLLDARFKLQPQIAFESVTGTVRHIIDVVGTPFKVELFRLSDDLHDRERFSRRVTVPWQGREVSLPTAEDVIITKLRWLATLRRTKDHGDILNVMAAQRTRLDWQYLERWCDQHDTRALLDEIRASVPII